MAEIKKIIAGLGLGNYSQGVYDYAAKLASALDAELIAVNIINSRDVETVGSIVSLGYEVDGDHYVDILKKTRNEEIDAIIAKSNQKVDNVKTIIKVGNPIDKLLQLTLREEADMLVMGPKGKTNLEHVLVGSVASKLFRRSPVTVVSYRDGEHSERLKRRLHV